MPKNTLLKVSTKTGDTGESGLANGKRLAKYSPVFHALGDIDELNSWLGLLVSELYQRFTDQKEFLLRVQENLFYIGGELAASKNTKLADTALTQLEKQADTLQNKMAEGWTTKFLLPGGSEIGAHCDLARAVCRRAERSVTACAANTEIRPIILKYMNRLSDYLYILRCHVNQELLVEERQFIKKDHKVS